jgi:hypothetical protein
VKRNWRSTGINILDYEFPFHSIILNHCINADITYFRFKHGRTFTNDEFGKDVLIGSGHLEFILIAFA